VSTDGARLAAWRDRLGLSEPEAARSLNVSTSIYRGWEQGRLRVPPSVHLLCRYQERFGSIDVAALD